MRAKGHHGRIAYIDYNRPPTAPHFPNYTPRPPPSPPHNRKNNMCVGGIDFRISKTTQLLQQNSRFGIYFKSNLGK